MFLQGVQRDKNHIMFHILNWTILQDESLILGFPTHHTQIRVFQKEVNIAANCIGEMLAIDERPSLDI